MTTENPFERLPKLLRQKRYLDAIKVLDDILKIPMLPEGDRRLWTNARADAEMINAFYGALSKVRLEWKERDDWSAAIAAQLSSGAPRLNVVFFHVDGKGSHPFRNGGVVDYSAALLTACLAAHAANQASRVIIVSDVTSDLSMLPPWVDVVRLEMDSALMMYNRMRANRGLLASGVCHGPALFLDTDIYLNRDFTSAFDGDFDIALTYRHEIGVWHMPVNEGLMLISNSGTDAGVKHFDHCLALYEWIADHAAVRARYGFDVRTWRGGQLSLAALLDWRKPAKGTEAFRRHGVRYTLLPCDDFNYSVRSGDGIADLMNKWAIHFKGPSAKAAMSQYFQATTQQRPA